MMRSDFVGDGEHDGRSDRSLSGAGLSAHARFIVHWFEALRPQTLDTIEKVYRSDAEFRDPFNDVKGVEPIRRIYAHMFEALTNPRFEITETVQQDQRLCAVWLFRFEWRGRPIEFEGTTWFDLDSEGRIVRHRDYWDVAHAVYERVPVLGSVLRALRRKMATTV